MNSQKTTTETKQEEEKSHGFVDGIRSKHSSEEFEIIEVENTPFNIMRQHKEYFVVLGKARLTEALPTLEEAIKDVKRDDWNRRMQVMTIVWKMEMEIAKRNTELGISENENELIN